jgi:hypothetical protein
MSRWAATSVGVPASLAGRLRQAATPNLTTFGRVVGYTPRFLSKTRCELAKDIYKCLIHMYFHQETPLTPTGADCPPRGFPRPLRLVWRLGSVLVVGVFTPS